MNDRATPWVLGFAAGFVALLIGWFFWPVHSGGHLTAPKAACLGNIKQIGLGMIMYSGDYDGRFPHRDHWMETIFPYLKNEDAYHDPALKGQAYGYAYNRELSEQRDPLKPETVPLVFDSVNLARNASGTLDSLPDPARHEGFNHVCYADGSAKSLPGKTAK